MGIAAVILNTRDWGWGTGVGGLCFERLDQEDAWRENECLKI